MERPPSLGRGTIYAASAYFMWGILPLYWKLLAFVAPLHILAFRILCSLLFVGTLLLSQKNTQWLRIFGDSKKRLLVICSGLIVTFNWGLFIWAVNSGHTVEASLGYYINPLISILLGLLFFRERLPPLQWIAFGCAALGVLVMTVFSGAPPWISLGLAFSFGIYSLLKKKITAGSLESLGSETLAAVPVGVALLFLAPGGLRGVEGLSLPQWALILSCGIITATPLYLFAKGAKLLPLSALGFVQCISPTFQFLVGVFVFGESFPPARLAAFVFIWASMLLYLVSLLPKKG